MVQKSPVEVGSLSPYLHKVYISQVVSRIFSINGMLVSQQNDIYLQCFKGASGMERSADAHATNNL